MCPLNIPPNQKSNRIVARAMAKKESGMIDGASSGAGGGASGGASGGAGGVFFKTFGSPPWLLFLLLVYCDDTTPPSQEIWSTTLSPICFSETAGYFYVFMFCLLNYHNPPCILCICIKCRQELWLNNRP
jgi:hypothetical protein